MEGTTDIKLFILTGPESTGKTMLAEELTLQYNATYFPEYAREYISGLNRRYNFEDVIHIAKVQAGQMKEFIGSGGNIGFFDTYLVITKIWLEIVYNRVPDWIDREIGLTKGALYLLCRPDIPWEPNPLRENGGEMRNILFRKYEEELKRHELNYCYIEGFGEQRLRCARDYINNYFTGK